MNDNLPISKSNELNDLSENVIDSLEITDNIQPKDVDIQITRNDRIAFDYLILGDKQGVISKRYDLSQGHVSEIINQYAESDVLRKRVNKLFDKKTSTVSRKQALAIITNIKPKKIVEGSKALSASILIDKARLLDGESTEVVDTNIQVNVVNYNRLG